MNDYDMTLEEIAQQLGVSRISVVRAYNSAMMKIKAIIQNQEGECDETRRVK